VPPAHCSGWTCTASGAPCEVPDVAGSGPPSTTWTLDLNIDTDVESVTDIRSAADIGHTYVMFKESNGAKFCFGFYPRTGNQPTEFRPKVFGCVVHPDTTHKPCIDYTKAYSLSQAQYDNALKFAQSLCKAPPNYDLYSWNCTTFVVKIAKAAGQNPPSAKPKVPPADNPNTLKEGFLDREVPTHRLTSDTEIRAWVSTHNSADIAALPNTEKIRLLNRLLDGWVSDEDVAAFEAICGSVGTSAKQSTLQRALGRREKELSSAAQRRRIHLALFVVLDIPMLPPGTAQG